MKDKDKRNEKRKIEIIEFKDTVNPEEKEPLSQEESEEIRKKLSRLLIGLGVFAIAFIIYIVISGDLNSSMKTKKSKTKETNETVEEQKETEEILPDGNIDINDVVLEKYKNIIKINKYDILYNNNILDLFKANIDDMDSISNKNKLYFASKSKKFTEFARNSGISMHEYDCSVSSTIKIPKTLMDSAVEETFGKNVKVTYETFYYVWYSNEELINVYKAEFSNDTYLMQCIPSANKKLVTITQDNLESSNNTNDVLTLNQRMVFIKQTGVYKDPKAKTLITNNKSATYETYIKKGTSYEFIFKKEDGFYHLAGIHKNA